MMILMVNLIFRIIKTLLVVVSVLIIYSLLMISVDSKSFEVAVFRMIGLEKMAIVQLIIC